VFFVVAPGVIAFAVPWWMTGWETRPAPPYWLPLRVAGALFVVAGTTVLVQAFVRFVREGAGTPAPVAPTERLVVGGLYRHVRNPMYLAVLSVIIGQALIFWRPSLLAYAAVVAVAFVAFVRWYEEPVLADRYGAHYTAYRRAVPGWWPRRRPWKPGEPGQS